MKNLFYSFIEKSDTNPANELEKLNSLFLFIMESVPGHNTAARENNKPVTHWLIENTGAQSPPLSFPSLFHSEKGHLGRFGCGRCSSTLPSSQLNCHFRTALFVTLVSSISTRCAAFWCKWVLRILARRIEVRVTEFCVSHILLSVWFES